MRGHVGHLTRLAVVVLMAVIGSCWTPVGAQAGARVVLVPAAGPAGAHVTLTGAGFAHRRRVAVRAGRRVLARVRASRTGKVTARVRVPGTGTARIALVTGRGPRRVVSYFVVSPAPDALRESEVASSAGVRLRARGVDSRTLHVTGAGFPRGSSVGLSYRGEPATVAGTRLSPMRAGSRGSLLGDVALPWPPPRVLELIARARGVRLVVPVRSPDPIVAAAGDIACDTTSPNYNGGAGTRSSCRMRDTSELVLGAQPSAVLTLGDTQYEVGALPQFLASFDPTWGRLKSITYPAVGNHEYLTPSAAGYFDYFDGVGAAGGRAGDRSTGYYSYDIGAWHVIVLNSECSHIQGCGGGSPQDRWLRADLAAHRNRCTLAYWHEPRFTSGSNGNFTGADAFWRNLYAAGADLILNGHDHDYERFAPQDPDGRPDPARGIREIVVGTGGRNLTPFGPPVANSEVRNSQTFGVLFLTMRAMGYDWRFAPVGGAGFQDSGSGECH